MRDGPGSKRGKVVAPRQPGNTAGFYPTIAAATGRPIEEVIADSSARQKAQRGRGEAILPQRAGVPAGSRICGFSWRSSHASIARNLSGIDLSP